MLVGRGLAYGLTIPQQSSARMGREVTCGKTLIEARLLQVEQEVQWFPSPQSNHQLSSLDHLISINNVSFGCTDFTHSSRD